MRLSVLFGIGVLALCLGGCVETPKPPTVKAILNWHRRERRIVVIRPDVVLGLVTTGGLIEPQADWSEAARGLIVADIVRRVENKGVQAVVLDALTDPQDGQMVRLYSALVAGPDGPGTRADLRKHAELVDSLGEGTQALEDRFGADYGLFLTLRDNYTSSGRVASNVAASIVILALSAGRARGPTSDASRLARVSLVELHTGTVVWTETHSGVKGNLREAEDADRFVDNLLKEMPL
jgi:hypothetical protein